jgi:hypothetical protein
VWKRPTEYRDATTYPVPLLYEIWHFNTLLKYSWTPDMQKCVGDYIDSRDLAGFVARANKSHNYTINTDYKTSGLTMPRWFAGKVKDKLNQLNPKIICSFADEGWPILDKSGEIYESTNFGYGLGAVNNLYTLFTVVIHRYAKEIYLIDQDSEILSFNDDSTFTNSEPVLARWLDLVRDFGGWPDESKSVQLQGGTWFCELHQLRFLKCNFKSVSAFHTMYMTVLKSVNKDHWRFLATDTYDAIRGWNHDISAGGKDEARSLLSTISEYTLRLAQNFFGVQFNVDCPIPEAGGLSLGYGIRTPYALKGSLVWMERAQNHFDIKEWCEMARVFMASKDHLTRKLAYRPWKKFPEGRTKSIFECLGAVKGIHHELEAFSDKAGNKFVTDSHWHRNQMWLSLSKVISDAKSSYKEQSFWDWALGRSWPNEAIPTYFVESVKHIPEATIIPWVDVPPISTKYTLVTTVVKWVTGETKELNLGAFFNHPTMILGETDEYLPVLTPIELEKVLDHGAPKKVLLDYFLRNGDIPTELRTQARMSKAALELVQHRVPDGYKHCDGATWWTILPIPYKNRDLMSVKHLLPIHQPRALYELLMDPAQETEYHDHAYTFEYIGEHEKYNKEFWKTSTKKAKGKRTNDADPEVGQMFPHIKVKDRVADKIASLDGGDSYQVMHQLYLNMYDDDTQEEVPVANYAIGSNVLEDIRNECFLNEPDGNPSDEGESNYDSDQDNDQQDYENDLVNQFLESGCQFDSDSEDDDDNG